MPLSASTIRGLTDTPEGWDFNNSEFLTMREGFEFTSGPDGNAEEFYTSARSWANLNSLQLIPHGYDPVSVAPWLEVFIWTQFRVESTSSPDNISVIGVFECRSEGCDTEIPIGSVFCPTCENFVACGSCRILGTYLFPGVPGSSMGICYVCSVECATDTCQERLSRTEEIAYCTTCSPRFNCSDCGRVEAETAAIHHDDARSGTHMVLCSTCTSRICSRCNNFDRGIRRADGVVGLCDECINSMEDSERAALERWRENELPAGGNLIIPSSNARPTRTISIETEFDGNGAAVGRALFRSGLTQGPERNRYSSQGESRDRFPCVLKSDGSVSGGELVTYLLDLDDENHAAALMRMTEVMRGCREMSMAQFSSRAGGHIHIDLHGYTMKDLYVYYSVFQSLQNTIFFMAGAGASYGHRALEGNTYASANRGGPFDDVRQFAANCQMGRSALNIGHYRSSMENCSCGAYRAGMFETCECNLGKATAEWRVWNSEVNPRILHGWIAFMQAVTAYSQDKEDFRIRDFPENLWSNQSFNTRIMGADVKRNLEWIHRELPLTIHERDSLVYVCKQSQLSILGDEYLDSLMEIVPNSSFADKKKAPNPLSRKSHKFAMSSVAVPANLDEDAFYPSDDYDEDDDDREDF